MGTTLLAGLAFISSLLLDYPVCSHAACGDLGGDALSLLQTSATARKENSSTREGPSLRGERLLQRKAAASSSFSQDMDAAAVVARLNACFSNGRPSKKLNEAGVILHAFDGDEEHTGEDRWFYSLDHWSASIVNARVPYMYLGNPASDLRLHAGFVISPESAADHLLCSYDRDGLTGFSTCKTPDCIPGCVGEFQANLHRDWCSINTTGQVDDHCAWPPSALDTMMERQELQASSRKRDPTVLIDDLYELRYNEVVLDNSLLKVSLAKAIEAIYVVAGSAALSRKLEREGEEDARAAQRLLLRKHGRHVPLVRIRSFSEKKPFEFVGF